MKQINCSVSGTPTDIPRLIVDTLLHEYAGVFESPTRVIFLLPDAEPTDGASWGTTIHYAGKTARALIPEFPSGSVEGPLLAYPTALARLSGDGPFLRAGDRPFTWAMMTGFCDYQLWLTGQHDQLRACWQQAKDLGSNGRRVLGMMAFITQFDPRSYGDRYFTDLSAFAAAAAEYQQRLHFDVFADNQIYKFGQDFWARVCDQLRPIDSVLIGAGNEWPKNGFDPTTLPFPGVFSSQGSTTSDAPPPMPGWGVRMWHGRRDSPKVWISFDDAFFVSRGINEAGQSYAPVAPIVHDEPIGFASVDVPNRRSTDPLLARSLMLSARALGAGMTFHSESGMHSRLLEPIEQTCARACFDHQG